MSKNAKIYLQTDNCFRSNEGMEAKLVLLVLAVIICSAEAVPIHRQKKFSIFGLFDTIRERLERTRQDISRGIDEAEASIGQAYEQIRNEVQGHVNTLTDVFQTINDQVAGQVEQASEVVGDLVSDRETRPLEVAVH